MNFWQGILSINWTIGLVSFSAGMMMGTAWAMGNYLDPLSGGWWALGASVAMHALAMELSLWLFDRQTDA